MSKRFVSPGNELTEWPDLTPKEPPLEFIEVSAHPRIKAELARQRAEVERLTAQIKEARALLERFNKATYEVVGPYDELDSVRHAYGKWIATNPDEK